MGFMEGRIVFNSETGIYYSGQTVFGKLIFDQEKNKSFRGIYVKLKGFCYVHWRSRHTRTVNGKQETYYVDHTSQEDYVNQKNYLIGSEHGEMTIHQGHYEYPFQFVIPPHCPSSYEGTHGHIRYEVKAVVDRAFKIDQEKKAVVRVIAALDLNSVHGATDPVQITFDEAYYCCCTRSGSVRAVVKLPYGGYIPGQTIPIEVGCDNTGSVTIDSITFTLKKDIKFHAQGTRSESQDVAQLQLGEVRAGTSRNFTAELLVPHVDTANVRQCRYIDIDHRLKVTISPDGCHSNSSQSRDIVIGTIPVAGSNYLNNQEQNVPVVNQPTASAYPGGINPYPEADPYPSNTPYPGPLVTPYPPTNAPYPSGNDHPPYPPPYTPTPSGNSSYPTPYPTSNNPTEKAPYPGGPSVTPYPTSNPPYPASNSPYPTSTSPYPTTTPYPTSSSPFSPAAATGPYPSANTAPTSLRTGTLGFIGQTGDHKPTMPQLPQGALPYPYQPASNPFATASAPQPASPSDEQYK